MKRIEPLALCLLLALFGFTIFRGTLGYPMVFDDEIYLVGNPIFKEAQSFRAIFSDFKSLATIASRSGLEGDISTNFLMRPLTYLSFHWNYRWDGLNPSGYRLVNILIHFFNALLVWRLSQLVVLKASPLAQPVPKGHFLIPWVSSLLFFVHPLQIESVVYIIQRATSLCCLFYLATIVLHLEANRRANPWWRCASIISAMAAMLSKESGATVPVLAVIVDMVAFGTALRPALWRARGLLFLLPILPMLLTAVSYAQTGRLGGQTVLNIANGETNPHYGLHYAFTQPGIWLRYLGLIVWPDSLNIDPDIPMVKNARELRFWGAALVLALGYILALLLRSTQTTRFLGNTALLGVLWFTFTILPDSSIVPLPDCMAEHRSYLPSVGIFILGATLLCVLPVPPLLAAVTGLCLTSTLATATVYRCAVWASPQNLWKDVCDKSPQKSRPWLNLGAACFDAGKLEEAEAAFIQSIRVSPSIPAFANLACINLHRQQPQRAYEFARMGMPFRPSGYDHLLLINLGDACRMLNKKDEAIAAYQEALQRFPERLDIRLRLCSCLLETSNAAAAVELLRAATALHPNSTELREAIAQAERLAQQFKLRLGP